VSIAIQAENISKAYQIGEFSTGTITKDIDRWWKLMRGKEDPYLKIGETNDRSKKGTSDVVWSLKDINFDIQQGDAVGIIGRNGAGKSTLLKILSRTTSPTTGSVKIKGRIASLLEVGTGFHPELTGKENIFLNGAILGMRKHEIKKHFDAIVDFSGVERYIDTPVKRYSSGMYVRLAFAVAAHLESEILIVDEVLAVGDSEFQKKCLGKMGDVSKGEGRTILFVSHNMGAIQQLCKTGIMLQNGLVKYQGTVENTIDKYMLSARAQNVEYTRRLGNRKAEFINFKLCDVNGKEQTEFFMGDDLYLHLKVKFNEKIVHADIGINIKNNMEELITHVANFDVGLLIKGEEKEIQEFFIKLENILFSPNSYYFDIAIVSGNDHYDMLDGTLPFTIIEGKNILRGSFPSHIKLFTNSKWKKNDKRISG